MVWDGRFTNNAWLQETPKPITKLTWDNAALVSPATAERLRLKSEFLAELRFDGRTINAAVWIVPGQADGVVTLHLGYGQQRSGRVGRDTGFNAYALRADERPCGAAPAYRSAVPTTTIASPAPKITTAWKAATSCAKPRWTITKRIRTLPTRVPTTRPTT